MRKRSGATTIREVAKLAAVSVGTVSRVVNEFADVDEELRERVRRAIRELKYRPNLRAQQFTRDRTKIIGFVLSNGPGLSTANAQLLLGVEEHCASAGYCVLFARCHYGGNTAGKEIRLPSIIEHRGLTDSVILAGETHGNFLRSVRESGLDYVVLTNHMTERTEARPRHNQVRYDDYQGAIDAIEYLSRLGHRHIWFLGDTSKPWYRSRFEGYCEAMRRSDLESRAYTVALSDDPFENGHAAMTFILEQKLPVSAVLAASEEIALGVRDSLRIHAMDAPRDISLICFEHRVMGAKVANVTSVCIDTIEVGRQLARMAVARLESGGKNQVEVVIPAPLVKRGSCRPLRGDESMML